MKIRIGDRWGLYYDKAFFLLKYLSFTIKEGIRFTDINDGKELILKRMYETHKDFLPKKDGLMIDIGVQFGDYAMLAAKKYGTKVIGFEASTENYRRALINIERNRLEDSITLFNLAVGSVNGEVSSNYNGTMINAGGRGEKQIIKMILLDEFLKDVNPDLIKIDIEGYELEALKGMKKMLLKYKPRIVIETHSWKLREDCFIFLYNLGYELIHENPGRKGDDPFDWVQETFWSAEE